jgi:hypothetical protein
MEELDYKVDNLHLSPLSTINTYDLRIRLKDESEGYMLASFLNKGDNKLSYEPTIDKTEFILEVLMSNAQKILPIKVVTNEDSEEIMKLITDRSIVQVSLAVVAANHEIRAIEPSFRLIF